MLKQRLPCKGSCHFSQKNDWGIFIESHKIKFSDFIESAKDGLLSSSLSHLFCYAQRKGIKEKALIPFLARKERLDRASPVLLASQALPFFVPFASQKMDCWVRVSPIKFHTPKKKKHKDNSLCFFWRGRRDSNSRAGFPTYALSRGASSPTWVLPQVTLLKVIHFWTNAIRFPV